jgi:hypothetical protein
LILGRMARESMLNGSERSRTAGDRYLKDMKARNHGMGDREKQYHRLLSAGATCCTCCVDGVDEGKERIGVGDCPSYTSWMRWDDVRHGDMRPPRCGYCTRPGSVGLSLSLFLPGQNKHARKPHHTTLVLASENPSLPRRVRSK